ncbi:iron permease [Trametes sanguinea]|nr:iron permease [Trametes sanguinea]
MSKTSLATPSTNSGLSNEPGQGRTRKGSAFWLCFLALLVAAFLSALDLSAIPTALPTIINELHGGDKFVWVGSAYGLSSAAVLILAGRLADIWGRKPVMLASIALFCLGSILAGSARNMDMLIAARVIQGMGGGPIVAVSQIITSDLVSLAERGVYQGIIVLVWALAAGIGPVVGGALAEVSCQWRWLFYLNIPLTVLAFVLVTIFLRVRTPEGSARSKLMRVDWLGNALVAVGATLALLGLTWGGIQYPWSSVHVLVPLILGFVFITVFFVYEVYVPGEPTMPLDILANRTSFSGYLSTFVHGIISISAIYYLPVYFQACLGTSALQSSVNFLPVALVIAPFAVVAGLVVKAMNRYRPLNIAGWIISIVGFGLMSLLKADSPPARWIPFQLVMSVGTGIIYTSTVFPILAPLPVSRNAAALAFFVFCRTFSQTWGITIAGTILQNQLKARLPHAFASRFSSGVEIAYASIPLIHDLPEPLRTEVRAAFATSMSVIWKTMAGLCGVGIVTLFFMKEVPMVKHTDETYGLQEKAAVVAPTKSLQNV